MKILLIYPYFIEDRIHQDDIQAVPMGLYTVAAVLKANHYDVEILNWYNIDKWPDRIEETLIEKRPDVIGFSILHANRWGGIEIARIAKRIDQGVKIIFGGIGATFLWEHFLTHFPEVDFVVLGEGEYTFLGLLRCIEAGNPKGLEDIRGIAFNKNAKPIKMKDADPIADLDALPIPAKYFEYQHVTSTRGCAWRCSFCGSPNYWGQHIRFRSPAHFVEELDILYNKGNTFFYFSDDTFTMNKRRVIDICKRILDRNLKIVWYAISRVQYVDDDILYWMRKAGCIQISYGIESGSEKIRKAFNKKIEAGAIRNAFEATTKYGILSRAYFIYGSPGETEETVQETIELIRDIKPLSVIFYILDLFPGTALYENFRKRTRTTDDIWLEKIEGIMYFETDPKLSDTLVLSFGKRLRRDFYEQVHLFAQSIDLIDKEDLYEAHADFCSRLAMTFSHGDYSKIETVREKDRTAEFLFKKSLDYLPNIRAYLGLGVLKQRLGRYDESIRVLSEGVACFPDNESLTLSLGISYMNVQDYERALFCFKKYPNSKEARINIGICHGE